MYNKDQAHMIMFSPGIVAKVLHTYFVFPGNNGVFGGISLHTFFLKDGSRVLHFWPPNAKNEWKSAVFEFKIHSKTQDFRNMHKNHKVRKITKFQA